MKVTRDNITAYLLNEQFSMIGKKIDDTLKEQKWKDVWTMTEEQKDNFKTFAVPLIRKTFRCNKSKAEQTYEWFDEHLGLKTNG